MIAAAKVLLLWTVLLGIGCRQDGAELARRSSEISIGMKRLLATRLGEWQSASRRLIAASPVSKGRGWDARLDAAALDAMKQAWADGRIAYERVEGAIAPLFPESDTATDSRYDHFLTVSGAAGDPDPFDGVGVVGMHAIERIVWADRHPAAVIEFERSLPGYRPARFPATEIEAITFRDGLVARLLADVDQLIADFQPLAPDVAFAYRGLVDLAIEQAEKVDKAASGEEESRYAQSTMRDLRANIAGCREAYDLFRPWVLSRPGGDVADRRVGEAFARLDSAYGRVPGDAIPQPPATWSGLDPRPADLATPFGLLFAAVRREIDPKAKGSLVAALGEVAASIGLPAAILR